MENLTATTLHRALSAARELAELRELEDFPSRAAELVREIIGSDHTGYNAIDIESGTATVVADPTEAVFAGGPEALAAFAEQNPLIVRARAGDNTGQRLSDHISRRQLHRTDLYHHVYRVIGLEYQLGMQLPPVRRRLGRPTEIVGVSLCRGRRDFSDGEQQLLDHLRPLLAATLERLHELALLRAVAAGVGGEASVLLVDADGSLVWAGPSADGLPLVIGESIPAELRRLLVSEEPASATVRIDGKPMIARVIHDAYPALDAIYISPLPRPPGAEQLRGLGLTTRQSEVLALACDGLTSAQIAQRLTLSRRTVEHHFEAIYMRLGVGNRAQAVAAATGAVS
jgi:DNA-binding CsgD family transcriptional regulator